MNKKYIIDQMNNCYQIPNKLTIMEHGISVWSFFVDLMNKQENNWKLPVWFCDNIEFIRNNILDNDIIKEYAIFHDCGKPFCKTTDEFG